MRRGELPKWTGRSYCHAAQCAGLKYRTPGDKARLVRILWDIVHHGGNQRKHDPTLEGLCNLCECQDSARHWMLECSAEENQQVGEQLFKELTDHLEAIDPKRERFRYDFSEGLIGLLGVYIIRSD